MSSTSRIHLAIVLSALVPWGGMALHAQAPVPGAHPLSKQRIELSPESSDTVLRKPPFVGFFALVKKHASDA